MYCLLFCKDRSGQGAYTALLSNLKQPSLYFLTIKRFLGGMGVYKKLGAALVYFNCYKLMSSFLTMVLVYC